MARYEVTGTATDLYKLRDIQTALELAGAKRINRRNAFGWSNQPHVATFAADSDCEAGRIAQIATDIMDGRASILAYRY